MKTLPMRGNLPANMTREESIPVKHSGHASPLTKIDVQGFQMYIRTEDTLITPALLQDRIWEPLETQLLMDEVKPGDMVFDLGANIGYFTLLLAKLVGDQGHVHA